MATLERENDRLKWIVARKELKPTDGSDVDIDATLTVDTLTGTLTVNQNDVYSFSAARAYDRLPR